MVEQSPPQPESSRRRIVLIGVVLMAVIAGVTAIGVFAGGGKFRHRPDDLDRPADTTDEEWEDIVAYRSMPEKDEIERLRVEFSLRGRQKKSPIIEPAAFDRLMELTRHPNLVVRCQSTFILGSFAFIAKREPYASDPAAVRQMTLVQTYLADCVSDPSPHIRGWAFRILGVQGDDRFIPQARDSLKSPIKAERDGAEAYLVALATRATAK